MVTGHDLSYGYTFTGGAINSTPLQQDEVSSRGDIRFYNEGSTNASVVIGYIGVLVRGAMCNATTLKITCNSILAPSQKRRVATGGDRSWSG